MNPAIPQRPQASSRLTVSRAINQFTLCRDSELQGAPGVNQIGNQNPNAWIGSIGNFIRLIPLAGAAAFPVTLELESGQLVEVYDSGPIEVGPNRFCVRPRTFREQYAAGGLSFLDEDVLNILFPAPTGSLKFTPGSAANSSGYLSGRFGLMGSDDASALAASGPLTPTYTWSAANYASLGVALPSSGLPILLPDFLGPGKLVGYVNAIPLGTGEGVIRHEFQGDWADPAHSVFKWYLDPLSGGWLSGGALQISPGKGGIMIIEETINLSLPTWLFLQLDQVDGTGDVEYRAIITRGGR